MLDRVSYDAFGTVLSESNPAAGDRFKYTGQQLDPVTGAYDYKARTYASDTGRFWSQDPAGFGAGSANLYPYVGNHPTDATDPTWQWEQQGTFQALERYPAVYNFVECAKLWKRCLCESGNSPKDRSDDALCTTDGWGLADDSQWPRSGNAG